VVILETARMRHPPINAVYLAVCTLCRPFDDQAQTRIRRETSCFFELFIGIRFAAQEIASNC
jgi:hypothetical protein